MQRNHFIKSGALWLLKLITVSSYTLGGRTDARAISQTRRFRAAPANSATPNDSFADPKLFLKNANLGRPMLDNGQLEEEAVDEYLEFLDRRYRRLHEKETSNSPIASKVPFSALNWLKQEQITDSLVSQQIQDDALYALGVAGLASKRLLSKHQIPPSCAKTFSSKIGGEGAIDVSPQKSLENTAHPSLIPKTVSHLAKARQALHAYQTRKFLALSKVVLKTPMQLLKKLWIVGGGKRSLTITLTLASILIIAVIRPLVITLGKESLNIFGSS